jgi:hypothetical protein
MDKVNQTSFADEDNKDDNADILLNTWEK